MHAKTTPTTPSPPTTPTRRREGCLLKIEQVAERLNCSTREVYHLMKRDGLPYVVLPGRNGPRQRGGRRVRPEALDHWLDERDEDSRHS